MSGKVRELPPTANSTGPGYAVEGSEELKYTYSFVDNVFDEKKNDLASYYKPWGRVLCILDENLDALYGKAIRSCESLPLLQSLIPELGTDIQSMRQTSSLTASSPRYTSSRAASSTRI